MKANIASIGKSLKDDFTNIYNTIKQYEDQLPQKEAEFKKNERLLKVDDTIFLTIPGEEQIQTTVTSAEIYDNGEFIDMAYEFSDGEPVMQSELDLDGYEAERV